jgi:hypothetical protein
MSQLPAYLIGKNEQFIYDDLTGYTGVGSNSSWTVRFVRTDNIPFSQSDIWFGLHNRNPGFDVSGSKFYIGTDTVLDINSNSSPNIRGGGKFNLIFYKEFELTQLGEKLLPTLTNVGAGSECGKSVSFSSDGNVIAFGIPEKTGGGIVRIYERSAENITDSPKGWTSRLVSSLDGLGSGLVTLPGTGGDNKTGHSISLNSNGTIIAIGSPGYGNGVVTVWQYNGNGNWSKKGAPINGESSGDKYGQSVSLNSDGTILAIGSPDGGNNNNGYVIVYEWSNDGGNWSQKGYPLQPNDSYKKFGWSVSLNNDGTILAVGDPESGNGTSLEGGVYTYKLSSVEPKPHRTYLSYHNIYGNMLWGLGDPSSYGQSVSLSGNGNILAIGASGNHPHNGKWNARVYIRDEANNTVTPYGWTQLGGDIPTDLLCSLSLNNDGTILAVGSPYENNNSTTDERVGNVKVYEWRTSPEGEWYKIAEIEGESTWDWFGISVSLVTNDTTRVAIGASMAGNDTPHGEEESGNVTVYELERKYYQGSAVGSTVVVVAP